MLARPEPRLLGRIEMSITTTNLLAPMLYEFSLPTKADKVPTGPDWLHEVKYDGYRMMLIREQDGVRLTRNSGTAPTPSIW